MGTLLMRLEAPMQSWGTYSRFSERDTAKEPTKSGVIGLICSAMGIDRGIVPENLTNIKFAVRVDKEGVLRKDYHIAGVGGYFRASGKVETKNAIPTNRYYLADASFLVGIESEDDSLIADIQAALENPVWFIYLGRKSFLPSKHIYLPDGVQDKPLLEALIEYPVTFNKYEKSKEKSLRFIADLELMEDKAYVVKRVVQDVPIDFDKRIFHEREVAVFYEQFTNKKGEDADVHIKTTP